MSYNYRYAFISALQSYGDLPGPVGDVRRATSGEGETEPKHIGEGTREITAQRAPVKHHDICSPLPHSGAGYPPLFLHKWTHRKSTANRR